MAAAGAGADSLQVMASGFAKLMGETPFQTLTWVDSNAYTALYGQLCCCGRGALRLVMRQLCQLHFALWVRARYRLQPLTH